MQFNFITLSIALRLEDVKFMVETNWTLRGIIIRGPTWHLAYENEGHEKLMEVDSHAKTHLFVCSYANAVSPEILKLLS